MGERGDEGQVVGRREGCRIGFWEGSEMGEGVVAGGVDRWLE